MLTTLLTVLAGIIGCILLLIVSFLYLCMNVFTLPLFILCWLLCKLLRLPVPRAALYSLMLYPSWKSGKHPGFFDHVAKWCKQRERRAAARRSRRAPIRAWEERFF